MRLASFDIFDTTLLRRCGKPEAVWQILGKRLYPNDHDLCEAFVAWRRRAKGETLNEIYANLDSAFPAFAEKMKKLKDITVSDEYLKEYFSGTTLKVDSMKSKADLYLIDFKKNPFKSNSLAIVTLGFYTRKKAKETLERVKEEKKRLEEEMARMDSELVKLRNIKQALELIAEYYLSLIELYRALLNRLDNSVNFLMIRCISFAHKLVREQMSIKLLPKSQQAEIMAMVSISKVLKSMVDKNITMEGKTEKISSNVAAVKEEMRKQKEEIKKLNEAA